MADRMIISAEETRTLPDGKTVKIRSELYDGDRTQEIFIDGLQGLTVAGSTVKINCYSRGARQLAMKDGEVEQREVVARLVMGIETFLSLVDWLKPIDADLRSQLATAAPGLAPITGGSD